jgi:hypothetical protein
LHLYPHETATSLFADIIVVNPRRLYLNNRMIAVFVARPVNQ